MKLKPIAFLKSFNWNKEDFKKILMLIIMLLVTCAILNTFLTIKVKIIQRGRNTHRSQRHALYIRGSVDAEVSGDIDAEVSGDIDAEVSGDINAEVSGDINAY